MYVITLSTQVKWMNSLPLTKSESSRIWLCKCFQYQNLNRLDTYICIQYMDLDGFSIYLYHRCSHIDTKPISDCTAIKIQQKYQPHKWESQAWAKLEWTPGTCKSSHASETPYMPAQSHVCICLRAPQCSSSRPACGAARCGAWRSPPAGWARGCWRSWPPPRSAAASPRRCAASPSPSCTWPPGWSSSPAGICTLCSVQNTTQAERLLERFWFEGAFSFPTQYTQSWEHRSSFPISKRFCRIA